MAWIKRNLFFVLSIVAGLILTGYCGYLFASDLHKNKAVNTEFQQTLRQWNLLQVKPLFPSDANIARAKEDRNQLEAFKDKLRGSFAAFPAPPKEDEHGFSTYLEATIVGLTAEAEEDAVVLPDDMMFGFTDQRQKLKYPPENIQPWMQQLAEIKALCDILFNAKINSLTTFRRVPVSTNDLFVTPGDTFPAKIVTNMMETITPYKIEFRGFTRELAAVIEGLAHSSNCYNIKDIEVMPAGPRVGETGDVVPEPAIPPPAPPPQRGRRGGATTTPGGRGGAATTPGGRGGAATQPGQAPATPPAGRGRGRRGGVGALEPAGPILVAASVPPSTTAAAPAAPGGTKAAASGAAAPAGSGAPSFVPGTILREQLLLIMISVEVVKFN